MNAQKKEFMEAQLEEMEKLNRKAFIQASKLINVIFRRKAKIEKLSNMIKNG